MYKGRNYGRIKNDDRLSQHPDTMTAGTGARYVGMYALTEFYFSYQQVDFNEYMRKNLI